MGKRPSWTSGSSTPLTRGELQYVVAGIGFNVSQREEDFVGEVSKIATSILRETGRLISRAELSAAMIEELDALYTALRSGSRT